MKPFCILILLAFLVLGPLGSRAGTSSSLRIVGRAPASVDIDVDGQAQMLKARANFPFLMSYRKARDEEQNYVVRVAREGSFKLPGSEGPIILEIIAP